MRTYGTLALRDGAWTLEVEPHVLLKLKRVFPKVSKRAHGAIRLSDSEEIARDLEWFMLRYPLATSSDDRAHLEKRATARREEEALVTALLAGVRQARPFDLAIPAREYQRVAAEMCLATGGLLLADDLGLGKTCTGICVLSDPRARPALVVTMTHLTRQWEEEIQRFAPSLQTHVVRQATPYDLRKPARARKEAPDQLTIGPAAEPPMPDVVIMNYHKLSGWADTLAPVVKSVIYDEAQELRRSGSQKTSAAAHITEHAHYRLALTATPIYNLGDEMFNVISAVRPGALGSRAEFIQEWCTAEDQHGRAGIRNPAAFGTFVRESGLMLRRTREEVGRELPPLMRIPHRVDCDMARLDEIESAAGELARVILGTTPSVRGEAFRASEELSGMVRRATGVAKAPYVSDFVRMVVETGEKVVLYGWHREVYGIWLDRLSDLKPAMYTGSESPTQKQEARRQFLEGETSVLIMSLRAGAGLDGLQQVAKTVVFGELDWSPGVHDQCAGRLHRDGQAAPVIAYYLLADHGSDPVVADVLGVKRAQAQGIRDPKGELVAELQGDGQHVRRLAEAYLRKKTEAA